MKRLLSSLLSPNGKSRKIKGVTPRERQARLELESLEARVLMSATIAAGPGLTNTDVAAVQTTSSVSTVVFHVPAPSAPVYQTFSDEPNEIDFSWQPASWASGYEIEVINSSNGSMTTYYPGSATNYSILGLRQTNLYAVDVAAYGIGGTTWGKLQYAITDFTPDSSKPYSPADAGIPLWGASGPSPYDVRQGNEGDCWLIASLSEVADRAPQDIENMFHYDGTTVESGQTVGLYTIRFFNESNQPVYITVDTTLPLGGFWEDSVATQNGAVLWVALAEKAYAEANYFGYVTTNHDGLDAYSVLDSGYAQWALTAITGQNANNIVSVNSDSLNTAWNDGDFVILATQNPSNPYIVPNHAYAVLGSDGGHSFELLNPWGLDHGFAPKTTSTGQEVWDLFWVDMAFIDQNFVSISMEVSGAAPALQTSNATNSTDQFVPSSITSAKEQNFDGIIDAAANLQLAVYGNTNKVDRIESWEDVGYGYSVQLN
jgi:hypothetical protein